MAIMIYIDNKGRQSDRPIDTIEEQDYLDFLLGKPKIAQPSKVDTKKTEDITPVESSQVEGTTNELPKTIGELEMMYKADLQALAQHLNLSTSGTKTDLINRVSDKLGLDRGNT